MDNKRQIVRDNYARIASGIAEAAAKSGRKPEDIAFMAVTKTVDPVLVNEDVIKAPWKFIAGILDKTGIYNKTEDAGRYVLLVTLRDHAMALTPSLKILVD